MWELKKLLSLLDESQVDQVVLQESSVPCTRQGNTLQPVSDQVIESRDIAQWLKSAGLAQYLQKVGDAGIRDVPFAVDGRPYQADILMKRNRLQLRLSLGKEPESRPIDLADLLPIPPPVPASGTGIDLLSMPSPSRKPALRQSPVPLVRDQGALAAIESILNEARRLKASDVHISPGYSAQVRLIGQLTGMGPVLADDQVRKMLLSLLDHNQQSQLDALGYADLAYELPKAGRLRVNISRQRGGLKGCFRLIDARPATLEELGLPKELARITIHHQGLVVVSGPNGAGKTASMASLVNIFNISRPVHIITVEDPIEIRHAPKKAVISQREVGRHTRTFDTALRGALREDPDIIAIGELRDLETVEMALSAAETGHLVIATMSTPSGAVTIDRLIDMFPRGVQSQVRNTLAGTLKMVISQRMVPAKDRKRRYVAAELITGCIPLYAMIRDNKLFQLPSLLQQGRAYGMIRIEDSLNALVQQGLVDLEVAKSYANDPNAVTDAPAPESAGAAAKIGRTPTKVGFKSAN